MNDSDDDSIMEVSLLGNSYTMFSQKSVYIPPTTPFTAIWKKLVGAPKVAGIFLQPIGEAPDRLNAMLGFLFKIKRVSEHIMDFPRCAESWAYVVNPDDLQESK
jgi:hypothetical protein